MSEVSWEDGSIKWWNEEKGYGFIISGSDEPDTLIHVSLLERAEIRRPINGEPVKFTKELSKRGWRATALKYLSSQGEQT